MANLEAIVDTREQKPYKFEDYPMDATVETMDTGDYTIRGYEDVFAAERKTKPDFLRSITHDRERFKREIRRADEFKYPLSVVVESPYSHFKRGFYYPNVPVNSVTGTVEKWREAYNVDFLFEPNRAHAEHRVYLLLAEWAMKEEVE